jgi:hypothetical protein
LQFVVLGSGTSTNGVGLFSGRPGTQSVKDFADRLLAAYAKNKLKEKRLTKAEFLLQLPAYLEHETLQLWRKKREEILTEPEDSEKLKTWDPIAAAVKLFKEHLWGCQCCKSP